MKYNTIAAGTAIGMNQFKIPARLIVATYHSKQIILNWRKGSL
jgi:hypothetical protein